MTLQQIRAIVEACLREPDDPRLLAVAYDLAREQDDWARRLSYALRLSKASKAAAAHVIYGIECGRNAMPERAEGVFRKTLEIDPKSMSALNGLAMCSFEKVEVGRAEELFRKSQKAGANDCAVRMLRKIELLRKGEPSAKRAESRRKFWKHWQDTELTKMSDEQRQKRMAEVVARRR